MRRMGSFYFSLALMVGDVGMVGLAYFFSYFIRFRSGWIPVVQAQSPETYIGLMLMQVIITPLILATQGLYRPRRNVIWTDELSGIFAGTSMATILVMAIASVLLRDSELSRSMLALIWGLLIVLTLTSRFIVHNVYGVLRALGVNEDRVLVVGAGDIARLVINTMRDSPGLGARPIGVLTEEGGAEEFNGAPVLGHIDHLGSVVREQNVDEVIIAIPSLASAQLLDLINKCQGARVGIKVFPDMFQIMASEVSIGELNGLPLISVRDVALRGWNLALKRAMDIAISGTILVAVSPIMLFLALLVKLSSPNGPVFFTQERVGLDNRPFQTLKFRTMRPDAEKESGPVWARAGDDRTTGVGKFLRRFSLDELPQMINVLKGEMSMVGPRPERPYFVRQFQERIPRYLERHNEKAGLTGWAQVNGLRGDTSIEERTAYDLWYVENWTIWLDIKIMLRTFLVVLRGDNAY